MKSFKLIGGYVMIGRIGGGPVEPGKNEMLGLVFLVLIPISLAFTAHLIAAIVYLIILIGGAVVYAYLDKRKTMTDFNKMLSKVDRFTNSRLRYLESSYRKERGDFRICRTVVVGDKVVLYFKNISLSNDFERKETIVKDNCDSIVFNENSLIIKYSEDSKKVLVMELEIQF